MTPSNMSGALPTTTASMSAKVSPASSSAASAASRTRPAMETSSRLDLATVWPIPMTAQRSAITPLQDADEVLLQARARGGVRHGAVGPARPDRLSRLADADEASRHHRVGREGTAGGVDDDTVAQPQRLGEDQLLVGVGRVQLGHVDLLGPHPRLVPASFVEEETVRSRAPTECVSTRWSIPVMKAGRSHHS